MYCAYHKNDVLDNYLGFSFYEYIIFIRQIQNI